jgi:AAA domain
VNTAIKQPNAGGWERDVAKSGAQTLTGLGYHYLLTLPHNHPSTKYEKIKGKAPGVQARGGMWVPRGKWQDRSVKPDYVADFKDIGRKTRFVPNLGVLLGGSVEFNGEHAGYLTAIDIDADDESVIAEVSELFGYSNPIRRGRRGGTFFCITTGLAETQNFVRDDENKVQLLRDGAQSVVFGVHPKTLKLFRWETVPMDGASVSAKLPALSDLPIVSSEQIGVLLAKHGFERGNSSKATSPEEKSALSKREKEIEADLNKTAALDFEDVDEALGITALLETDAPLKRKLNRDHDEGYDHSTHDLECCNMLRRHLGAKLDHHAARAVLLHFPSCSEADKLTAHHIARIMAKAEQVETFEEKAEKSLREYLAGLPEDAARSQSDEGHARLGELLAAVVDEEDDGRPMPDNVKRLAEYIRREAEREAAAREAEIEAAELATRERELTAEIAVKSGEPAKLEGAKPIAKKRQKGPLNARGGDLWRDYFAPDWAVAGMLPEVGTAIIYGDSNTGKTFLALHLLDRISRGATFLGRRTSEADTLYVGSEGGGGLSLRMKAMYDAEPFTDLMKTPVVRSDLPQFDKSPENAAQKIKLMALEAKKESGRDVGAIVLDNWALMVGDRDENDNSFAAAVLKALSKVADELGCLIVILHHTSKDQKNYRGPSAMRAAVDAMYSVKMTKELTKECEIECSKVRDGPKPPKMYFKLRTVEIGHNKHREPITSLVVADVVRGEAMGTVDDTADDSALTPTDTPEDKMRGVLVALTTRILSSAATTGDNPSEVGVSANQVFIQLNTDREARDCPK